MEVAVAILKERLGSEIPTEGLMVPSVLLSLSHSGLLSHHIYLHFLPLAFKTDFSLEI